MEDLIKYGDDTKKKEIENLTKIALSQNDSKTFFNNEKRKYFLLICNLAIKESPHKLNFNEKINIRRDVINFMNTVRPPVYTEIFDYVVQTIFYEKHKNHYVWNRKTKHYIK